ncbi:MAG: glycosyltransferase family 39 protein [Phycisphaerae bacterium]
MTQELSTNSPHAWVRKPWCVRTALGLLILGFCSNLLFLYHNCPFDLSEDESQYWLWSRHLAWGYYSKGPGIAAIIYAATAVGHWFGQHATMPIIRTPAVIFAFFSGLASFFLARRMFRDDRAGLMVIALSAGVPVFAVGSLIITIDSPMYLCWAWACVCLWLAVEPRFGESGVLLPQQPSRAGVGWLYLAGLLVGLGTLCKPILLLIPPSLAIAAWRNTYLRRKLATWHSLGATLLALAIQIPNLIWNAQHHWIMFRAIGGEGGLRGAKGVWWHLSQAPLNVGMFILSQAGIFAGILFVLLVLAFIEAIRDTRKITDPIARAVWDFLIWITLPIFIMYFLLSFWSKVEPNWPAGGYFTGMILFAGVATRWWNQPLPQRKAARRWIIAGVAWGFSLFVFAENVQLLYPVMAKIDPAGKHFPAKKFDPAFRLHALKVRGQAIEKIRLSMWHGHGPLPMVMDDRWDTSSSLSYYLPGHPFVFCLQTAMGGKQCQFDLWPGPNQINPRTGKLRYLGRDAVLTGSFSPQVFDRLIKPAFAHVSKMFVVPLYYYGVVVKHLDVWKCYGFKGMPGVKNPVVKNWNNK